MRGGQWVQGVNKSLNALFARRGPSILSVLGSLPVTVPDVIPAVNSSSFIAVYEQATKDMP